MAVPDYQTLMLPVLRLIEAGHETIPQCIPRLIEQFGLSPEEADDLLPSGKQTKLANRAHWARNYMSQAGLVEPIRRGHYRLTDTGRELLSSRPTELNKTSLEVYPPFQEFLARSSRNSTTDAETAADAPQGAVNGGPGAESLVAGTSEALATPAEIIATAHAELVEATAVELLDLALAIDPARFEQLIVDLLLAMGYGGGDRAMGRRLGRTGDGGIDGVIDEDALGLDAVYVQAKRYALGNTVGRPAIQQFIGSLTGEGATKGVFVTTSAFSQEARDYAARVQHRVVLIDGPRLARLMIQHDVGVRTRETYAVKTVDEDYFADPEA